MLLGMHHCKDNELYLNILNKHNFWKKMNRNLPPSLHSYTYI